MIDVVYNIGPDAGDELRYSLRTLKNLPHVGKVYIMSFEPPPAWLNNYVWVPREMEDKWMGTHSSFIQMCSIPFLTRKVYLMEDDMYILRPQRFLANHSYDTLAAMCERRPPESGEWGVVMANTMEILTSAGVQNPVGYEAHIPMVIDRSAAPVDLDEGKPVRWYTVYGNIVKQRKTVPLNYNVKVVTNLDLQRLVSLGADFLSSLDSTFKLSSMDAFLERLFPDKSQYER
jgi:hypothetical protein